MECILSYCVCVCVWLHLKWFVVCSIMPVILPPSVFNILLLLFFLLSFVLKVARSHEIKHLKYVFMFFFIAWKLKHKLVSLGQLQKLHRCAYTICAIYVCTCTETFKIKIRWHFNSGCIYDSEIVQDCKERETNDGVSNFNDHSLLISSTRSQQQARSNP